MEITVFFKIEFITPTEIGNYYEDQPAVAYYSIKRLLPRGPEQLWQSAGWACQALLHINRNLLKWVAILMNFTWCSNNLFLFLKINFKKLLPWYPCLKSREQQRKKTLWDFWGGAEWSGIVAQDVFSGPLFLCVCTALCAQLMLCGKKLCRGTVSYMPDIKKPFWARLPLSF